jgi:hypothetical protein
LVPHRTESGFTLSRTLPHFERKSLILFRFRAWRPSAALRAERTAKIEAGTDAGQCRTVIVFMPGRGGKGGYMGRHRDPENRPEGTLKRITPVLSD